MFICFSTVTFASSVLVNIPEPIPGQSYFDQRFDNLERQTAEIKGDTSQIVSILGNVFEGTVPSGGTLTGLCNRQGWNLVVLMGHNNITNPNVVEAGQKFTYPQNHEEFQQALAKGKPLYDNWLKNQSTTFRVNRIKVDTVEIDELNVRVASFKEELEIKNMKIDQLQIRLAEITEKLSVKKAEIEELNVRVANFQEVNIDNLKVKDAQIENLRIENLRIKNALIDKLRIKQLEIDNLHELLSLAENRCRELEARPPKIVERAVPVTPGEICFRQDNDCGEPYIPGSWEIPMIQKSQGAGLVPVYWYLNCQPDGSLKVKVDYFDFETRRSYSLWCQRNLASEEDALKAVEWAGFSTIDNINNIVDGGTYKTLRAGRVINWPKGLTLK